MTDPSTEVATIDSSLNTGLEDFDTSDMVIPRLRLVGAEAVFEDNLSKEKFPSLKGVVLLGLVKQRVLWDTEIPDGDARKPPLCKSPDAITGYPSPEIFPWDEAGMEPKDGLLGDVKLDCSTCPLAEWGSHPTNTTPWCSEQFTFVILVPNPEMATEDEPLRGAAPSIVTFQRSAVKAVKSYLSSFARSKTPLFTVYTDIDLEARKRGSVKYAVPSFVKGAPTNREDYGEMSEMYRSLRDFLHTPPSASEDPAAVEGGAAPTPAATAPAAAAADDDDLPF